MARRLDVLLSDSEQEVLIPVVGLLKIGDRLTNLVAAADGSYYSEPTTDQRTAPDYAFSGLTRLFQADTTGIKSTNGGSDPISGKTIGFRWNGITEVTDKGVRARFLNLPALDPKSLLTFLGRNKQIIKLRTTDTGSHFGVFFYGQEIGIEENILVMLRSAPTEAKGAGLVDDPIKPRHQLDKFYSDVLLALEETEHGVNIRKVRSMMEKIERETGLYEKVYPNGKGGFQVLRGLITALYIEIVGKYGKNWNKEVLRLPNNSEIIALSKSADHYRYRPIVDITRILLGDHTGELTLGHQDSVIAKEYLRYTFGPDGHRYYSVDIKSVLKALLDAKHPEVMLEVARACFSWMGFDTTEKNRPIGF